MDDLDWKAAKMQRTADEAKRQVGALPPTSFPESRFGGTSTLESDVFGSQLSPEAFSRSFSGVQSDVPLPNPGSPLAQRRESAIDSILLDDLRSKPGVAWEMDRQAQKDKNLRANEFGDYKIGPDPDSVVQNAAWGGLTEYAGGAFDAFDVAAALPYYAGRKIGKGISKVLGEKIPEQKQSDEELFISDMGAVPGKFAQRWSGDYSPHNWDRKGLTTQIIDESIEGLGSGTARGALGGIGGLASILLTGSVPTRVSGKPIAKAAASAGLPTTTADDVLKKIVAAMKPPKDLGDPTKLNAGGINIFGEGDFTRSAAADWVADAAKAAYSKVRKMIRQENWGSLSDDAIEELRNADEASIADVLADKNNNPALYKALKKRFKAKDADIKANLSEEKVLDAAADETQEALKAVDAGDVQGSAGDAKAVRPDDAGVPDVQQQQLDPSLKSVLTKEEKRAAKKQKIQEEIEKRKVQDVEYERVADEQLKKEFPEEYRDNSSKSPEEIRMEEEFNALQSDAVANKDQILAANKSKAELRAKRFKPSSPEKMGGLLAKIEELRTKVRNGDESKETEQALRALTEKAGELSTRAASKMKVANAETRLKSLQEYTDAHPDRKYLVTPDDEVLPNGKIKEGVAPRTPQKQIDEATWDLVVDQGLGHRTSALAYDSIKAHDKAAESRKILDEDLAALGKYNDDDIETAVIKRAQEQGIDPGKYLEGPIPKAPFSPPKKDVTLNVSDPKPTIKRPRIKKAEPVAEKPAVEKAPEAPREPDQRTSQQKLDEETSNIEKTVIDRRIAAQELRDAQGDAQRARNAIQASPQDARNHAMLSEAISKTKLKGGPDDTRAAEAHLQQAKNMIGMDADKLELDAIKRAEDALERSRSMPAKAEATEAPKTEAAQPKRTIKLDGGDQGRKFEELAAKTADPEAPYMVKAKEQAADDIARARGEPSKPKTVEAKRFKKAEAAPKTEKPKSLTGEKPQPRSAAELKVDEWAERQVQLEKTESELLKDNKTSYDWTLKDEEIKKLYDSSKDPIQGPPRDNRPDQGPHYPGPIQGPSPKPPLGNKRFGPSPRAVGEFAGYRAYGQFKKNRKFLNPLTTKNTRGLFRDFGGPLNSNNILEEFHGTISNMEGPAARELAAKFGDIPKRALDIASKYMPRLMKSIASLGYKDRAAIRKPFVVPGHTSMEVSRAAIEMDEHTGKLFRRVSLDPLSRQSTELFDASKEAMKINHDAAVDAGTAIVIAKWDPVAKKMVTHYDRLARTGPDETRFLRQPNREFSEHIKQGNKIGDKFMEEISAVPINKKAGVTPQLVEHVFAESKAAYARGEAFEFRRFIPFMPDWWTYRNAGSSKRFQVNDMIDNFVPTKGASGKSIATTMSHQSKRAAFVEGVGNIHVPPDVAGFKSIMNDDSVAKVRSEITSRSNIGPAAKKAARFESALEGLTAAVSGNRSMAGYSKSLQLTQPTAAGEFLAAGLNAMKSLAVAMVPVKSATQPFMLASHMPGGLHKNVQELFRIALDMGISGAGELASTASKKLGSRFTTSRDVVAKHGAAQDDFANQMMSVFSHKPGSQHTANRVAANVTETPVHMFQLANDIVKRAWDAVAIKSGERQAKQYAKMASQGKLKASDYVDLTQRGASNDSIGMLVNYKKNPPTPEQMDSFIRELAVVEAQTTQRNLGQAHQNTRFLNSDGTPRLYSFLGYPTTMMRETENIFKKAFTTAKMSLDDARTLGVANSPEELASIKRAIVPKMIKDAIKLYVPLGAGGMILDEVIDNIMNREDTDLEKRYGLLGKFGQGLVAVNAYGMLATLYDSVAAIGGFPRLYATRGGKEEKHYLPVEPFVLDAAEKSMRIGAAGLAAPFVWSGLVDPKKGTKGLGGEIADLAEKSPVGRAIVGPKKEGGSNGRFNFSKYKKQNLAPDQNQLQPPREGRYNFKKYKRAELSMPATGKFNFAKYKRS